MDCQCQQRIKARLSYVVLVVFVCLDGGSVLSPPPLPPSVLRSLFCLDSSADGYVL